jgi:uncharacterized protein YbaA (DUF1428 family)
MNRVRGRGLTFEPEPGGKAMARYVDGFIIAIPENNLDRYREISTEAGKLWRELGALDYTETVAEDVPRGKVTDFYRSVDSKDGETVVFSWIAYESREHRDQVNAKVMADERMKRMMEDSSDVFDAQRMIYGGFEVIVDA